MLTILDDFGLNSTLFDQSLLHKDKIIEVGTDSKM